MRSAVCNAAAAAQKLRFWRSRKVWVGRGPSGNCRDWIAGATGSGGCKSLAAMVCAEPEAASSSRTNRRTGFSPGAPSIGLPGCGHNTQKPEESWEFLLRRMKRKKEEVRRTIDEIKA